MLLSWCTFYKNLIFLCAFLCFFSLSLFYSCALLSMVCIVPLVWYSSVVFCYFVVFFVLLLLLCDIRAFWLHTKYWSIYASLVAFQLCIACGILCPSHLVNINIPRIIDVKNTGLLYVGLALCCRFFPPSEMHLFNRFSMSMSTLSGSAFNNSPDTQLMKRNETFFLLLNNRERKKNYQKKCVKCKRKVSVHNQRAHLIDSACDPKLSQSTALIQYHLQYQFH